MKESVSFIPTKIFCLLAGLAASAALLGCVGAGNSAAPKKMAVKPVRHAAQALPDAPFASEENMFFTPSIAQDARGNRIAVWGESDGARINIWAKRSLAGMGWGAKRRLDAHTDGNADSPRVAFDIQGNAMAVWEQQIGGHYKVWANRYVSGQGWGAAQPVDTIASITPSNAFAPQVALNALGEAMAVWQQSDGNNSHIRTSRFVPGAGWIAATSIGSVTAHANAPQIAFDAQDNALVVWQQHEGQKTQVWASQQSAGGTWARAMQLSVRAGTGDALNPSIAVDPMGKVIAVWRQDDGTSSPLWARRYSAGAGWSASALAAPQVAAQTRAYQ